MDLRYGLNLQQAASAAPVDADRWPLRMLRGTPSYINLLDALNAWQLVPEARQALDRPAAASFKHVSPAGVAVAGPVDDVTVALHGVAPGQLSAVTSGYLRSRDADPRASFPTVISPPSRIPWTRSSPTC